MSLFRVSVAALPLLAASIPCVAAAPDSESSEALRERIIALEEALAAARQAQEEEARAQRLEELAAAAAGDAANRSFYLGDPCTVVMTPGKGIQIAGADGGASLRFGFYTQFRYIANFQNGSNDNPAGNVDELSSGFEFRRTRLYLTGRVLENLDYFIMPDFGPSGRLTLADANFTYHIAEAWCVTAGQFPMPLLNELTIPVPNQLMVELSSTLGLFNPERTQGVMLQYRDEALLVNAGVIEGPGGKNTDWNSDLSEVGLMARGEWKLAGEWKQFDDFTASPQTRFGATVGGGVYWQEGDVGDGATPGSVGATAAAPTPNLVIWTVDSQLEWPGLSLFGAVTGRHVHPEGTSPADSDDYTYLVQSGVYLTEDLELIGRYEHIDLQGVNEVGIATFGFIRYLAGNAHKITVDGGFTTDAVPAAIASDRVALEVDAPDADRQFFLRAQWQIVF